MFIMYVLLYPLAAIIFAMLANYFFPFPFSEPLTRGDQFFYLMYQLVDYLLALFMLFFCFLLLRRICKRSLAFLIQLPLPLTNWARYKHIVPIMMSVSVLTYLFQTMFIHTLVGLGFVILFEWFSRTW